MEIAIISDTHLPRGSRQLPDGCRRRCAMADLIVHAGDLSTLATLRELQALGPPVTAVHGNVDDAATIAALPAIAVVAAAGTELVVTHDGGSARGRLQRLRRRFPHADAVVFGHSHLPLHERAPDGFQIFNPGSPTERRRAPRHTMGLAHAGDGGLTFELVALD